MSTNDNNQPMIFFDLDGVLADFKRWVKEKDKINPDGKIAWEKLDEKWWATMPPCDGAKDAYDAAKKLGIVKFLTSPARYPACFSGKADWVENFTGIKKFPLRDLILCFARDKQLLANPNRILIDDSEDNINQWIAAGGIGILHNGDFKETMKSLELALAKLKAAAPTATPVVPKPPIAKVFNRAPRM
jgi:hypothetical protein